MFVPSVYLHTYGLPKASRQGKVSELRQELNFGGKKDKNHAGKKIALKKIVANMTMSNNDMVALFPDVVACMDIHSLEIKKMYAIRWEGRNKRSADWIQVFLILGELRQDQARHGDEGIADTGAGYEGQQSPDTSARIANNVIHPRIRVCAGYGSARQAPP